MNQEMQKNNIFDLFMDTKVHGGSTLLSFSGEGIITHPHRHEKHTGRKGLVTREGKLRGKK